MFSVFTKCSELFCLYMQKNIQNSLLLLDVILDVPMYYVTSPLYVTSSENVKKIYIIAYKSKAYFSLVLGKMPPGRLSTRRLHPRRLSPTLTQALIGG